MDGSHLFMYLNGKVVTLVDPTGTFEWHPRRPCNRKSQNCLDLILRHLKSILTSNNNCFQKDKCSDKEAGCRNSLTDCLLHTIDSEVKIGCDDLNNNAEASGLCVRAKNIAAGIESASAPVKGKKNNLTPDSSCNACDGELLKETYINFDNGKLRELIGEEQCTPTAGIPRGLKPLAEIVVHELLHTCTGGHLLQVREEARTIIKNKLERPDAKQLANEFIAKCWT